MHDHLDYMTARRIRARILHSNSKLPDLITADGATVVGFADECSVRQGADFFQAFLRFLAELGESTFFLQWTEAGYDGFSQFDTNTLPASSNFVSIQTSVPENVLYEDSWVTASLSGSWAIYGEQYGSELAAFVATDEFIRTKMYKCFEKWIEDAVDAVSMFGDPTETRAGQKFAQKLVENYPRASAGK